MTTALLALTAAYADDSHAGERLDFNVSESSSNLSEVIRTINTSPYFEGHDNRTVEWMESLGNKKVFIGDESIVIMNITDAGKIPPEPGITDVWVYNYFSADVIESHSLGDELRTVYHVENVTFKNQEIVGNGLA